MKSEIVKKEARTVEHRKNQKAKIGDVKNNKVPVFRGLDKVTTNYMRNNKYYPRDLLVKHDLEYLLNQKELK